MSTNLEKIQAILPRSCDEEYLIAVALNSWSTDKSLVNKQQICLAIVNTALQKLAQINPFYSNITIHNEWEDLIKQSALVLWKLLTDKNAQESNNRDQTDSDDDIEGNDQFKDRELKESFSHFPTVMYRGYFRNWGQCPEDTKRVLFHYKNVKKGTLNLTSPYVHSLFTIVLIKRIFEKKSHWGQLLEVGLGFRLKILTHSI